MNAVRMMLVQVERNVIVRSAPSCGRWRNIRLIGGAISQWTTALYPVATVRPEFRVRKATAWWSETGHHIQDQSHHQNGKDTIPYIRTFQVSVYQAGTTYLGNAAAVYDEYPTLTT